MCTLMGRLNRLYLHIMGLSSSLRIFVKFGASCHGLLVTIEHSTSQGQHDSSYPAIIFRGCDYEVSMKYPTLQKQLPALIGFKKTTNGNALTALV